MEALEQAQNGLGLLKDAILVYLAAHPEGASAHQIRRDLKLNSANCKGQRADHLVWGLLNLLVTAGEVRDEQQDGWHHRYFLAAKNASQPASVTA